jgi:hypothetical protein
MNGRAWLARQMDRAGIRYLQQDNCFPWVADWGQAQRLINTQQEAKWPELLDEIAHRLNPIHDEIFSRFRCVIIGRPIKVSGPPIACSAGRRSCGGSIRSCCITR